MTVLAEFTWGEWFIVMTVICICALLMLIILVQRGRGEGLSGAFGGGGGSGAFGAKTGDVFTWITVAGAVIFLLVAVVANFTLDESSPSTVPASGVSSSEIPSDTVPDFPATPVDSPPITLPAGDDSKSVPALPSTDPKTDTSEDLPGP